MKTRALAVDAIRGGRVKVNGQPAKPSKDIKLGDEIEFSAGVIRLTATVRGTAERRLPASDAAKLYERDRGQPRPSASSGSPRCG